MDRDMKALRAAALLRARRTLYQGLGGSALTTALVALVVALSNGDRDAVAVAGVAALVALGTTLVTAATSYFQGMYSGLPEVPSSDEVIDAGSQEPGPLTSNPYEGEAGDLRP